MSIFEGIETVESLERTKYLPRGSYTVRINKCMTIKTKTNIDALIVQFTVTDTNNDDVLLESKYGWFHTMYNPASKFQDTSKKKAQRGALNFLYSALGLDESRDAATIEKEVKPNARHLLDQATSDKNSLNGVIVKVDVVSKPDKHGEEFATYTWRAVK